MSETKRIRTQNFSSDEKMKVLSLVERHKNIIENKRTDAVSCKEKDAAWEKLANTFNAGSSVMRSKESLRKLYEKLKRDAKVAHSTEKINLMKTGGGPNSVVIIDPVILKTSTLMGRSCTGLQNPYDDDFEIDATKRVTLEEDPEKSVEADVQYNSICIEVNPNDGNSREFEMANELTSPDVPMILEMGQISSPSTSSASKKKRKWCDRRRPALKKSDAVQELHALCKAFESSSASKKETEELKVQHMMELQKIKVQILEAELKIKEEDLKIRQEILRNLKEGTLPIQHAMGLSQRDHFVP
ncbi:myb/SANT-like DNA-binding domain-containing protein 3 [Bacillus rossius redtenbacheri]|uniref:myb/SANT-like DNA-binding domain-containing protein 3 n=1 Tax=Bacillus rossius redtenbacheri TaxID=93214 RepID=UPI002FDE1958